MRKEYIKIIEWKSIQEFKERSLCYYADRETKNNYKIHTDLVEYLVEENNINRVSKIEQFIASWDLIVLKDRDNTFDKKREIHFINIRGMEATEKYINFRKGMLPS